MSGVINPGRRDTGLLTTVMKGLAIARDVYGIKSDMSKIEAADAEKQRQDEERERFARGELNTGDQLSLAKSGLGPVPEGTPGAIKVTDANTGLTSWVGKLKDEKKETPLTRAVGNQLTERQPDGSWKVVHTAPRPPSSSGGSGRSDDPFKGLPEDQKITVRTLATDNAKRVSIANQMREELANYRNAKTEDEKVKAGQGMLKLLNSPLNPDAVGKEEAERIGSFLEYKKGNFFEPGSFIGRDLELFETQVADKIGAMDRAMAENQRIVDEAMGRQPKAETAGSPKTPPPVKDGATAYGATGGGPSLDDIDAELQRRGVKRSGATGGY